MLKVEISYVIMLIFSMLISIGSIYSADATSHTAGATSIEFDDSEYYVDHGALIKVTDPPSPITDASGNQYVTVTVTETTAGATTPNISVQLFQSSPGVFTGYVYFKSSPNYPNTAAYNSPIKELFDVTGANPITITASYSDDAMTPITTITTSAVTITRHDEGTIPAPPTKLPWTGTYYCTNTGGDTDGDGLCQSWETNAGLRIPYPAYRNNANPPAGQYYLYNCVNGAGPSFVGSSSLDQQCPDPDVKDVYVEIDYLKGHAPDTAVLDAVIEAFKKSPVDCSGGTCKGIKLHIQLDENLGFHKDEYSAPVGGGAGGTDFDNIKKARFGNATEWNYAGALSYNPILSAKRQAFHYILFMHAQPGIGSSGASEIQGNDIAISLGTFTGGVGSLDLQKGTLMHEIGHNLALDHGGKDDPKNCKPNYLSVMSHLRQDINPISNRALNFSIGTLNQVVEPGLSDAAPGVGASEDSDTIAFGYTNTAGALSIGFGTANGQGIDWNQNGIEDTNYSQQVSNFPITPRIISDCGVAPLTPLNDRNDWGSLVYNFRGISAFTDTYRISVGPPEEGFIYTVKTENPSQKYIDFLNYRFLNFPEKLFKQAHKLETNAYSSADSREFRSLLITTVSSKIGYLTDVQIDPSVQLRLLDKLKDANEASRKGDLIAAAHILGDVRGEVIAEVDDATEMKKIVELLDHSISTHLFSSVATTFPTTHLIMPPFSRGPSNGTVVVP